MDPRVQIAASAMASAGERGVGDAASVAEADEWQRFYERVVPAAIAALEAEGYSVVKCPCPLTRVYPEPEGPRIELEDTE